MQLDENTLRILQEHYIEPWVEYMAKHNSMGRLADEQLAILNAHRQKCGLNPLSMDEANEMLTYWTFEQMMEYGCEPNPA